VYTESAEQGERASSECGSLGPGASVYLDAMESGPSMADVMRDLRDLPDIANSVDTLSILDPTSLNLPQADIPLLGEISHLPPPPSIPPRSSSALPSLDATSSPQPVPPRPSPGPRRPSRRRSSAQYSIASGKRDPSVSRLRASAGRTTKDQDSRMDAVVQLHEESASAFHDFLFWAYPHLECKVTWTNVENVSINCVACTARGARRS
jgi:hypothetical protein